MPDAHTRAAMNMITCQTCSQPLPEDAPQGICPACLLQHAMQDREVVPPPLELEQLAAAFPQLIIEEMIGQGGMGRVFCAQQPHLNRTVALKVLSAERAGDPEWLERFSREARALARLSHPHIVQVYDFGEKPVPYLLMEHVEGVNLRQAMQHGGLTAREALAIVPKLCDALHYAHEHGVLHRDIKPENILIDTEGRVKLVDFGLAKLRDDGEMPFTLTQSGAKLGTLAYMAPEQVEKPAEVDHRADIYSLGVVFYEMLTGELPLGRFPTPSEASGVDARLDDVVMRTLDKQPGKRFQSAEQMRSDIEDATSAKAPRPGSPRRKKRVRYGITAAILAMVAVPWYLTIWQWADTASKQQTAEKQIRERDAKQAEMQRQRERKQSIQDKATAWTERATQTDSKLAQEAVLKEIMTTLKSDEGDSIQSALLAVSRLSQLNYERAPFRDQARLYLQSKAPEIRVCAIYALMTCQPDDSDRQRVLALLPLSTDLELSPLAYAMRQVSKSDFTAEFAKPMLELLERAMVVAQEHSDSRTRFEAKGALGAVWGSKVSPQIEARLIEWTHIGDSKAGVMGGGIGYDVFYHALSVQSNKSLAAVKRILELAYHPDTTNIAGRCLWGLNDTVPDKNDQTYVASEVIKLLGMRRDDNLWRKGLPLVEKYAQPEHISALESLSTREALPQARKESLNKIITTLRAKP